MADRDPATQRRFADIPRVSKSSYADESAHDQSTPAGVPPDSAETTASKKSSLHEPTFQHGSEIAESQSFDFLEHFLPEIKSDTNRHERNRARILVGLSLVVTGISIAVVAGHIAYGTTQGVGVGIGIGVVGLTLAAAIRAGWPVQPMSHVMMWVIYAFGMGITIASGGQAVAAVFAICLIPMFAQVVDRPSNVTRWTIATLAGIACAAIYSRSTDTYLFGSDFPAWDHMRFTIMTICVLLVYLGALILDWARGAALLEAESSRVQLDTQNERYRSLVENIGDVMMEFDNQTRCLYVSPNSFEVCGRHRFEMMGDGYVNYIHPGDLNVIRPVVRKMLASPGTTERFDVRFRHIQGRWIVGQMSGRAFVTDNGERRIATIFRDFTDLRRAELAIRHNQRLASAGTLAAGVAHQINNPIGSIRAASEFALLCARDGDLSEIETVLESNIEQATRCGDIVRSLLQFASREVPEKRREDLVEIVDRARELTKGYARERSIEIAIVEKSKPLWVDVSAIEIEQVFINLMRNALESGPDSKRVDVVVSRSVKGAAVVVRDDGSGIADVDQDNVFDPFFTTRIRDGGSGLGLSVAHGIVRDHGGSMELKSKQGKGTEVTVELPISRDRSPE